VLIMHGTHDMAKIHPGSQVFSNTAGAKDNALKLYKAHHEPPRRCRQR
jgi:hypothetical protein